MAEMLRARAVVCGAVQDEEREGQDDPSHNDNGSERDSDDGESSALLRGLSGAPSQGAPSQPQPPPRHTAAPPSLSALPKGSAPEGILPAVSSSADDSSPLPPPSLAYPATGLTPDTSFPQEELLPQDVALIEEDSESHVSEISHTRVR